MEMDLKDAMSKTGPSPFPQSELKSMLHQILSGTNHIHQKWLLHRDLKTSNRRSDRYYNYANKYLQSFVQSTHTENKGSIRSRLLDKHSQRYRALLEAAENEYC